jgi:glycosyltransferase involved in cell wall biosynthesis
MRVLMITQAVDPSDPLLAFVVPWVRALAARVERVHVLCLRGVPVALPPNVIVWTPCGEGRMTRARVLARLERALLRALGDVDVVLAHMSPRFAATAWPLAALRRRPIVLWYVHEHDSLELRLAARLSRLVTTAAPASFPFATPKLRTLGHGIDVDFFAPDPGAAPLPARRILQVARMMPIKNQATVIGALADLGPAFDDVSVDFVGGTPDGTSADYASALRDLAQERGVATRVRFRGPLSPDDVREAYRRATVAVNLSPAGLFDKAALESMMMGVLTIVSSPSFDHLLGEEASWLRLEDPTDASALRAALERALTLPEGTRRRLVGSARERAVRTHGLDVFMDRLVAVLAEAAR